jgi:peptidyl-prolyl cis-trans isomerase A (cyclophilin A)
MIKNHPGLFVLSLVLVGLTAGCQGGGEQPATTGSSSAAIQTASKETAAKESYENVKLYAVIETNLGMIKCELFADKAPETVRNFVELAEGKKMWAHPSTGAKRRAPFYDGLIFHRVIPNFMIQGGDPLGMGVGGPGYQFEDEIVPEVKFDKPGRLAMANRGPNTNGSQFFITVAPTPHLNGKHTIFGQVVEGQAVVNKITTVPRDARDKPVNPVVMQKVTIERAPKTGS